MPEVGMTGVGSNSFVFKRSKLFFKINQKSIHKINKI